MNSFISIPYHPVHADHINLRQHEAELLDPEKLEFLADMGAAITVLKKTDEARPIIMAFMGYQTVWDGVIDVFVIPSENIYTLALADKIAYIRYIRQLLKNMSETIKPLHRMHTYSLANDETDKWMKALGFTCEGTLSKFTTNRLDYRLWSRMVDNG